MISMLHFTIPDNLWERYVFTFDDPDIISLWTASYLHEDAPHLIGNMVSFFVYAGASYILFIQMGKRWTFFLISGIFLLITPFVTTYIDYHILHLHYDLFATEASTKGFSNIGSAYAGMLLAGITTLIAKKKNRHIAQCVFWVIVLMSSMILLVNHQATLSGFGLILIGFFFVGVLYYTSTGHRTITDLRNSVQRSKLLSQFTIISTALILIFSIGAFPSEIVGDGGNLINIFSHFSGFIFGLLSTFAVILIGYLTEIELL